MKGMLQVPDYQIDYEAMNETAAEKKNSASEEFFEWVETLIFGFFIVILVFTFVFRIVMVDGPSMLPTLENGQKVIVSYHGYTPKAKDIVIVNSEILGKNIVKRVIATEGQQVDIDFYTGEVAVDGDVLEEAYIYEPTHLDEGGFAYPVTVPENCIFIMGDNRNDSTDSRDARVGFVEEDDVMGKVVFRITPFNKFGKVE